jgi:hypothetical protein
MRARQPEGRLKEHQLAVRVPADLLTLLDDETERLRAERPGTTLHRSDTIREVLYRALRREDRK